MSLRLRARKAAAGILEHLPLFLLGDGSPLIGLTAAVVGLVSAWPSDNHPPFLSSHGGHAEVYAWVVCLLFGAGCIGWGTISRQWRVQAAGLMFAGTGLTVYGIAFAVTFPNDAAAVGVPPMVLGFAAGVRIVILTALGVTWEARNVGGEARDGE